jgi:hypothetical protein
MRGVTPRLRTHEPTAKHLLSAHPSNPPTPARAARHPGRQRPRARCPRPVPRVRTYDSRPYPVRSATRTGETRAPDHARKGGVVTCGHAVRRPAGADSCRPGHRRGSQRVPRHASHLPLHAARPATGGSGRAGLRLASPAGATAAWGRCRSARLPGLRPRAGRSCRRQSRRSCS